MRNDKGFTLIELMVIVAIIAILAAIAYPNYTAYVQRGRLAEMKSAMMVAGARLEKSNIANNKYPEAGSADGQFNTANIEHSDKYSYTYTRGSTDLQTYSLKGSESNFKIWAGINSSNIRCACKDCTAASVTFTETTNICPSGTDAF